MQNTARRTLIFFIFFSISAISISSPLKKKLPVEGGVVFRIENRTAFLIKPKASNSNLLTPWVLYAPTLRGLPGNAENWMFNRFLEKGIAIAGIDVGESYGSPEGRKLYTSLYNELIHKHGLSRKVSLLARSRGGLMLYNWAAENPKIIACIAGIYPVCNLESYPGLKRAAGAYRMTHDELRANLSRHNPVDNLIPLAKAKVPIFHIHGNVDKVVPIEDNSLLVKRRYEKLSGTMDLEIIDGQGHNMWSGWFTSQRLVDFVINHSTPKNL